MPWGLHTSSGVLCSRSVVKYWSGSSYILPYSTSRKIYPPQLQPTDTWEKELPVQYGPFLSPLIYSFFFFFKYGMVYSDTHFEHVFPSLLYQLGKLLLFGYCYYLLETDRNAESLTGKGKHGSHSEGMQLHPRSLQHSCIWSRAAGSCGSKNHCDL